MAANVTPIEIIISIIFGTAPSLRDFSKSAAVFDVTFGASGDTQRTYATPEAADTDLTAGDITAACAKYIKTVLGQDTPIAEITIVKKDTAAYADAMATFLAANPEYYGQNLESRADADLLALSAATEANTTTPRIYVAQTASGDMKTAGFPAGLAAMEGNERTLLCYHNVADEFHDGALMSDRLGISPDVSAVVWNTPLDLVADNDVTEGEATAVWDNNGNFVAEFGSSDTYSKRGFNLAGRPMKHIVTRDWFQNRVTIAVADLIVVRSNLGPGIPNNVDGQNLYATTIRSVYDQGVGAGHFQANSLEIEYPVITDADITAERTPLRASLLLTNNSQRVNFLFYFGN